MEANGIEELTGTLKWDPVLRKESADSGCDFVPLNGSVVSPDRGWSMAGSVADQVAAHAARNRELVALIVKKGADPTARRTIDLHFWAPDELSARRLTDALREFGLDKVVSNQTEADPSLWSVEGQILASVDYVVAEFFVERLVTLAAFHEADFDGWGTSL